MGKTTLFIALLVVAACLMVQTDAVCRCLTDIAGKYCGQRDELSSYASGCKKNHIYQCNGQDNSKALHYGPCTDGCAAGGPGTSSDYCRT